MTMEKITVSHIGHSYGHVSSCWDETRTVESLQDAVRQAGRMIRQDPGITGVYMDSGIPGVKRLLAGGCYADRREMAFGKMIDWRGKTRRHR